MFSCSSLWQEICPDWPFWLGNDKCFRSWKCWESLDNVSAKSTGCVKALHLLSWATTCSHRSRKLNGSCVLCSKFLCNIKWSAPAALIVLKFLIPSALKQGSAEYAHITVLGMSAHGFWQLNVVSTNVQKQPPEMQFESIWMGRSCCEEKIQRHWKVVPNWCCWHKLFWSTRLWQSL